MKDQIKQYLKTNIPNKHIFYNNPSSIKIQLPASISKPFIKFLKSKNIEFKHTTPEFIIRNFIPYPNHTQIHIKKQSFMKLPFKFNDLVTVPKDLGYKTKPSKEREPYIFKEYQDENTRCILIDPTTKEESLWSIGWIKPLKK